jgi:hypothetical protein
MAVVSDFSAVFTNSIAFQHPILYAGISISSNSLVLLLLEHLLNLSLVLDSFYPSALIHIFSSITQETIYFFSRVVHLIL